MVQSQEVKMREEQARARIEALVADPGGERPWGAGRVLIACSLFLATIALAWWCLGGLVDRYPGVQLDETSYQRSKAIYFAAHKDEFDTVFVGSSQVWRHIHPPTFDEQTTLAGRPTSSFNFGQPGMPFAETSYTVDWILDRKPARLKWLFIELRPIYPRLHDDNYLTRRQINWHSSDIMLLVCRTTLCSNEELFAKVARLSLHLHHWVYKKAGIAVGLPLLGEALGTTESFDPWSLRDHGCRFIDEEARVRPDLRKGHAELRENRHELAERIAELRAEKKRRAADPWTLRVLEELVARVRAAGVEPVFFVSAPKWSRLDQFRDAAEAGVLPVLFAYNDPERFPEFYAFENLFDFGHMSSRGALLYTRRLAADFLRYLEQAGG